MKFLPLLTRYSEISAPISAKLTDAQFYSAKDPTKPNLEALRVHFFNEGRLEDRHAFWILEKATEILKAEGTVLDLEAPLTVCGGIVCNKSFLMYPQPEIE